MLTANGHVYLDSGLCQGCGAARSDATSPTEPCPREGTAAPVVAGQG